MAGVLHKNNRYSVSAVSLSM